MNKNTEISERITQIIDYLGVSKNFFAKKLGYNRTQVIYDITNAKSAPSYEFFNRLLNSEFSEYFNINWLLTGKGSMLQGGGGSGGGAKEGVYGGSGELIAHLERQLAQKESELRTAYKEIGKLEALIEELKKKNPHISTTRSKSQLKDKGQE